MLVEINLNNNAPKLHAVQMTALVRHYLLQRAPALDSRTATGYRQKLRYFTDWWECEGPKRKWLLDAHTLAEFARHLMDLRTQRGKPLSWHTRNDALRRLRTVLRWAHGRGYVTVDFAEFVPKAKGRPAPRLPVGLTVLAALLSACSQTREPTRNRALVAMLAGTGIRREECASLRVENVVLYADDSGLLNLSVAKNDNLRTVAFDSATGYYLRPWLERLPYHAGPLFPSRNGRRAKPRPLTPDGLYRILATIVSLAGMESTMRGAHDLRRMFATQWVRVVPGAGDLLQKQMGHASYQTTLTYVLRDTGDVLSVMNDYPASPLAQLNSGVS